MANMQKYKLGQLGRILDENARDENYHADRIDSELTKNKAFRKRKVAKQPFTWRSVGTPKMDCRGKEPQVFLPP